MQKLKEIKRKINEDYGGLLLSFHPENNLLDFYINIESFDFENNTIYLKSNEIDIDGSIYISNLKKWLMNWDLFYLNLLIDRLEEELIDSYSEYFYELVDIGYWKTKDELEAIKEIMEMDLY